MGKQGYNIVEPVMDKVISKSRVSLPCMILRRTLLPLLKVLIFPAYALKRLLNHKMNHDVTARDIL